MIQLLEDGDLPVDLVQGQHPFGVSILLQVGGRQTAWKGTDRHQHHNAVMWEKPPIVLVQVLTQESTLPH